MARHCLVAVIQHRSEVETSATADNGLQQSETPALPFIGPADEAKCEDLERVIVSDDLEKFFQIGVKLPLHEREQLVEFLRENIDVFTWSVYEASGIDPSFVCLRLNDSHLDVHQKSTPRLSEMK